ncbi:hypothetical protein HK405_004268, partial [Cladochytrium tenue]
MGFAQVGTARTAHDEYLIFDAFPAALAPKDVPPTVQPQRLTSHSTLPIVLGSPFAAAAADRNLTAAAASASCGTAWSAVSKSATRSGLPAQNEGAHPMFSAERHHLRLAAEQRTRDRARLDGFVDDPWRAATALQFENMVMENGDDVVAEARTLLEGWVAKFGSAEDDVSLTVRIAVEASLVADAVAVREMVKEVVDHHGEHSTSTCSENLPRFRVVQDPAISMRARRELMAVRSIARSKSQAAVKRTEAQELPLRVIAARRRLAEDSAKREVEVLRRQHELERARNELNVEKKALKIDLGKSLEKGRRIALESTLQAVEEIK